MHQISVVIRNKNQDKALAFLLDNLTRRYNSSIDEIVVLDNESTDTSLSVIQQYGVKLVTEENFGYGSSANLAAASVRNDIVVIFSAHAFPVSHDFFEVIRQRFVENENLAGVRCIHNSNDFKAYILERKATQDVQSCGLIFCGSAFNRNVWKNHKFKDDISTFEDKEWSQRVLEAGYDIEFAPAIFCYDIKRSNSQEFFRYKNEVKGSYQLWHKNLTLKNVVNSFIGSTLKSFVALATGIKFSVKRLIFHINFLLNKPDKF